MSKAADDVFADGYFDFNSWSAPEVSDPDTLADMLSEMELEGRVIESISFIGADRFCAREWIEERAYDEQEGIFEKDRVLLSRFENIGSYIKYMRWALIEEPMVIKFTDGDRLELDFSSASRLRISMNSLPESLKGGIEPANVDASVLFSDCIGRSVISVSVSESGICPLNFDEEQDSYITALDINLDNGQKLELSAFMQSGHVRQMDENGDICLISFGDLRPGLYLEQIGDGAVEFDDDDEDYEDFVDE
ncbi:MAG: hypothetical protein IJG63_05665 [Oscillospiraceae bacterium]|nr:hypothetical protein [Oscillospiraceae bacterium]